MYLVRLDWHLEASLNRRERKSTIETLRPELRTDPCGTARALGELGSPRVLAAGRATAFFLSIRVEAFSTPDEIGISWISQWAWIIKRLIAAVTFLIGARTWRITRSRT